MAAVVLAHDASIGAAWTRANRIIVMEGSARYGVGFVATAAGPRTSNCRCTTRGYTGSTRTPASAARSSTRCKRPWSSAWTACTDQPHLGFHNGRIEPIQDSWERMIAGTPWVASCTVTVDADDIETCSGPDAGDALSDASFGDHGTREFFTHVRFHKHDEDRIVVHLLVELYARSAEEATDVLEEAARGTLAITSLAEESRPPASTDRDQH